MNAEGWCVDPFGAHEARWFSNGNPTILVRDGVTESHDEPPKATYEGPLVSIEGGNDGSPDDLLRADSAERPFDPYLGVTAATDVFDQAQPI
jgi:hypothetical protein